MSLAFTLRADDPDTAGATTYTCPAFTPAADAGIIVCLSNVGGATDAEKGTLDTPTWLSGAWTEEKDVLYGSNNKRMTVYSGKTTGSPGSDDITATFSENQAGCHIVVVEVTGQDTTDFVLQPEGNSGTGTSGSVTLGGALNAATSAMLAFLSHTTNEAHAPSGSETELSDNGFNAPPHRTSAQYEINDTTSGATWTTSSTWGAIGLEIKEAGGGGTAHSVTASDTITLSDAVAKAVGLAKSDTITLSDAVAKAVGLAKADTITLSDEVAKALGKSMSDTVTLSDAVAKAIGKTAADTLNLNDDQIVLLNGLPALEAVARLRTLLGIGE